MGEIVGAGLLAHVPTIMLPESIRLEINDGREISLVPGLRDLRRDKFDTLDYDTVVILDSHWATTVEFVVTAQDRRAGLFTSEELPRGMCRIPYDWAGDPELAHAIAACGEQNGTWITAIDDHYLPLFYATLNLWTFLGDGLPDKRWISMSVAQTGDTEDFLRAGRALGQAIRESDRKVLVIASGALSHTFWPLRELRDHEASDPSNIFSPEALAADLLRLEWLKAGDHARAQGLYNAFMPLETLRDNVSLIRVLHDAVSWSGLADMGAQLPLLSATPAAMRVPVEAAARSLLAFEAAR